MKTLPMPRLRAIAAMGVASALAVEGVHAQYAAGSGDASAPLSIAIGSGVWYAPAVANGTSSIALGTSSNAQGDYSQVFGQDAAAFGASAIAMGSGSRAFGLGSTAVGNDTVAGGTSSVAIGGGYGGYGGVVGASAQAENSIAIGRASVAVSATSGVGIGTGAFVGSGAENGVALGTNAQVFDMQSIAIGAGATARHGGSVAIGAGAETVIGAQASYYAYGVAAPQRSVGEVSIGSANAERKLTNLAPGSAPTDAVNVSQLAALGNSLNALAGNAVRYDDATRATVTLGGPVSIDGGLSGATRIANVAQGAVSATSTDAVNGSQLYSVQQQVTTLANATVGSISIGSQGAERTLANVADGSRPTDAVNLRQLDGAVRQANAYTDTRISGLSNGSAGAFQVNDTLWLASPRAEGANSTAGGAGARASGVDSMALGNGARASADGSVALGASSLADRPNTVSVGAAGAERQVTNVAAGSALSDAVNVGQLQAGLQSTLKQANGYTEQRFNQLADRVDAVGRYAYAGVASAMALQMPALSVPGTTAFRLGGATYRGEVAAGLSARRTSRNGQWSIGGGLGTSRGGLAAAAGAEWVFD